MHFLRAFFLVIDGMWGGDGRTSPSGLDAAKRDAPRLLTGERPELPGNPEFFRCRTLCGSTDLVNNGSL